MQRKSAMWAVLVGGSIAGALDIVFAISFAAYNDMPPVRLLQVVASGVLGRAAYAGGLATALIGLLCHFLISYGWAGAFVLASRRFSKLIRQPLVSGMVFGAIVLLVMRLVILPLSAFPHPVKFQLVSTLFDLLSHMFFFGVPIALAASQAARSKAAAAWSGSH